MCVHVKVDDDEKDWHNPGIKLRQVSLNGLSLLNAIGSKQVGLYLKVST